MILVTGATGHIGNVLVRELASQGKQVRTLVLPGEDCRALTGLEVERVEGDVLNPVSLSRAMQGVENVYHLAGLISILGGKNGMVHQVNVQGTHNMLEAALRAGVRRFVYTSSIHAITRVPHGLTIDESIAYDPATAISAYDRSKAEASLAVLQAVRQGLDAVIVCPTGVIGPYDYRRSEMGQLIFDSMRRQLQFWVEGAYDFVDVRDVARGEVLACEKGLAGQSYILSGERITVLRLLQLVKEITGAHSVHIRIPLSIARFSTLFTPVFYRLSKIRPRLTPYALETLCSNSNISHAKARRELGYSPRSLRESLADTVRWFQENYPGPSMVPNA